MSNTTTTAKNQAPKQVFRPDIYIGIDPGVHTGVAIWFAKDQRFGSVVALGIVEAISELSATYNGGHNNQGQTVHFIIEDARKRKGDPGLTDVKKQGAGSVKRDSAIWEEFCRYYGIPYTLKAPNGKLNAIAKNRDLWERQTGFAKQTSEHARCAAMLVWKL